MLCGGAGAEGTTPHEHESCPTAPNLEPLPPAAFCRRAKQRLLPPPRRARQRRQRPPPLRPPRRASSSAITRIESTASHRSSITATIASNPQGRCQTFVSLPRPARLQRQYREKADLQTSATQASNSHVESRGRGHARNRRVPVSVWPPHGLVAKRASCGAEGRRRGVQSNGELDGQSDKQSPRKHFKNSEGRGCSWSLRPVGMATANAGRSSWKRAGRRGCPTALVRRATNGGLGTAVVVLEQVVGETWTRGSRLASSCIDAERRRAMRLEL